MGQNALIGLAAGLAVSGLGRGVLRLVTSAPLPAHWQAAFAMLAGTILSAVALTTCAIFDGSRSALLTVGAVLILVGIAGHLFAGIRPVRWPNAALAPGLLLSLAAALAPVTKADDLYYHMLTGHRVLADGALRLYRLPIEQALIPQMGYQVALSVFHAAGLPDGSTLLALACSATLAFLVYGVVHEQTANSPVALFAAACCTIGLYPTVWHTTPSPHALGDLAVATAAAALFFPGALPVRERTLLAVLASAVAAFTKLSLLPLGLMMTALAVSRAPAAILPAAAIWLAIYGPLVVWATVQTGSPFGAASAKLFGSMVYSSRDLDRLVSMRMLSQTGFWVAVPFTLASLNGGFLFLVATGLAAWRKVPWLVVFVLLQFVLIAWQLSHEFRFFSGLLHALLIAGAVSQAQFVSRYLRLAVVFLLLPWLAVQAYYARPFVAVTLGIMSRDAFLERYIPFLADLRALDRTLPANATIFIPYHRAPSVYFPRPVIYSLSDWDGRSPLYHFDTPEGPADAFDVEQGVACTAEAYRNSNSVIRAVRTPGQEPIHGDLVVRLCKPH